MAAALRVALLLEEPSPVTEALDVALALAQYTGVAEPEASAKAEKVAEGVGGEEERALTLALALPVTLPAALRVSEACTLALPHAVLDTVRAAADGEALPLPLPPPASEAVKVAEGQAVAVNATDTRGEIEACVLALAQAISVALPDAVRVSVTCALALANTVPDCVGAAADGEALPLALPPPPPPASEVDWLTEALAVVDALPLLPGLLPEGEPLAESAPEAVRGAVPRPVPECDPLVLAEPLALGA